MKKIYIIVGIVIFALLGLAGFLLFNANQTEEEIIYQDVLITDPAVVSLYGIVNVSNDASFLKKLYQTETISNEYMVGIALSQYQIAHPNLEASITSSEIAPYIYRTFGNVSYTDTSIFVAPYYFSYDETGKNYTIERVEANNEETMSRQLVSAKKTDTEYVLTEKSIIIFQDETSIYIYNDVSHTNLLDTIPSEEENSHAEEVENYLSSASTNEYHFTFNGENFVLTSFKKIS